MVDEAAAPRAAAPARPPVHLAPPRVSGRDPQARRRCIARVAAIAGDPGPGAGAGGRGRGKGRGYGQGKREDGSVSKHRGLAGGGGGEGRIVPRKVLGEREG